MDNVLGDISQGVLLCQFSINAQQPVEYTTQICFTYYPAQGSFVISSSRTRCQWAVATLNHMDSAIQERFTARLGDDVNDYEVLKACHPEEDVHPAEERESG
ncbi:hypothetical protein T12_11858 [Trichinella patagoniensis]|uniref:Uncharacterized protein n=1 Tax=Trichinella patagoniensis TaxID=990121 RepID=A0A0V0YWV9_9BILA|nr:hypothetical protein T12_11858 [Trichinella patagoniensis]